MTQQPPFIAVATPADISAGLEPGRYLAQVRGHPAATSVAVEYATASTVPADGDAWFEVRPGDSFIFSAGPNCDPTWVRIAPFTVEQIGATGVALARAAVTA